MDPGRFVRSAIVSGAAFVRHRGRVAVSLVSGESVLASGNPHFGLTTCGFAAEPFFKEDKLESREWENVSLGRILSPEDALRVEECAGRLVRTRPTVENQPVGGARLFDLAKTHRCVLAGKANDMGVLRYFLACRFVDIAWAVDIARAVWLRWSRRTTTILNIPFYPI